jgi:hypothetical protein
VGLPFLLQKPARLAWIAGAALACALPGACLPAYTLAEGTGGSGGRDAGTGGADAGSEGGCQSFDCDPHNCGGTGHDCLGGACLDGVCQPVTLISGLHAPQAIVITADRVYFDDGDSVVTCLKTGCGPNGKDKQVIVTSAFGVSSLAVGEPHLYFGLDVSPTGSVLRCQLPTCDSGTESLAEGLDQPASIAVDDTSFYVVYGVPGAGTVMSCPLAGCGLSNMAAKKYATNLDQPVRVATTATDVYWITSDSHLQRCPITGCTGAPEDLALNANPAALTLAGNVLYYGDTNGGVIGCTLPSCGPVLLANASAPPASIAVDKTHAYWSEPGVNDSPHGVIYRVPLAGGVPKTMATDLAAPTVLAIDAEAIYWINTGTTLGDYQDGSVMKLAK